MESNKWFSVETRTQVFNNLNLTKMPPKVGKVKIIPK